MHPGLGSSASVRFGQCLFDPRTEQLIGADGRVLRMRAQSQQVFRILCRHLGKLVLRDDLIAQVWPDLNVTDDSLTQCVADIRRTLGDDQRMILQTVPKQGFILHGTAAPAGVGGAAVSGPFVVASGALIHVMPAPHAGPGDARASTDSAAASLASRCGGRIVDRDAKSHGLTLHVDDVPAALGHAIRVAQQQNLRIGIDSAARPASAARHAAERAAPGQTLVSADIRDNAASEIGFDFADMGALGGLGGAAAPRTADSGSLYAAGLFDPATAIRPRLAPDDVLPTIAIIPPRPIGQMSGEAVYAEVISDEIAITLSRSRELNVISRLSAAPFSRSRVSLDDIATRLNADFVISGTIRGQGSGIVLTLELCDARSQHILWSDRRSIDTADLLEDFTVVEVIVAQIRKAIVLNEIRHVRSLPVESLDNYSLLFGAVGLMHRFLPSDFQRSRALLSTLIDRAPQHPAPRAWLARWYVLKVQQGLSDSPDQDTALAFECASRALDIDPDNTLALVNRGIVRTNLMRQLDDAEDDYNTALDNNPSDANGRLLRGMLYAFQDRGDEAVRDTERALQLSPLDPHRFFFLALAAGACLTAEDYPRALELTQASLRLNKTHASTRRMLVAVHQLMGNDAAARAALDDLLQIQPNLRVSTWLKSTPSADFRVGRRFAEALRAAGVKE